MATVKLDRFTLVIAAFLWIGVPLVGLAYTFASIPLGCPDVNWLDHVSAQGVLGIVLAVSWTLAAIMTAMTFRLRKEPAPIPRVRRSIITFSMIFLCLGATASIYGVVEINNEIASKNTRLDLVGQNTAVPIFSSHDYNAFPKLLQLQNGSLWCVFYSGNNHVDSNNDGKLLQVLSHDNGTTWTTPVVIADDASYDTRNPALGQLANGSLLLVYGLYDHGSRAFNGTRWQLGNENGSGWSSSIELTPDEYNPAGPHVISWISPFGNVFSMNGHNVAAFYGADTRVAGSPDRIVLLAFNETTGTWRYHGSPMEGLAIGFNEADIELVGTTWLCVSRSTTPYMYYSYSSDGITWSAPVATTYMLGHSPDIVVLGETTGTWSLFCVHRGENGILRGGLATFNPATNAFWCEHESLFAAWGNGGSDFGYASAVTLPSGVIGFVNYDVVKCGSAGGPGMNGTIWWQTWTP